MNKFHTAGIGGFNKLSPSNIIDDLIIHIDNQLPGFVTSNTYNKIIVTKKNEVQHTTALSVYLMKQQDRVTFIPEVAQKGSAKIDIGVFDRSTDELIFTIEAKVLPTPKGTKSKPRAESEYVFAKAGEGGAGIERFKNGFHGLDLNEIPLKESGMVAYVKESDFGKWHKTINEWITDAAWGDAEHLHKVYSNVGARLVSKHLRLDNSVIKLHHFWVVVDV